MLEEAKILYNIMEETNSIPHKDYTKYIRLVISLTGRTIPLPHRCINKTKRAHAYLSDYLKGHGRN